MASYHNYKLTLTKYQIMKLKKASEAQCETTLRIPKENFHGNVTLPLTDTQINKIKKAKNGVQLKFSKSQCHI